MSVRFRQKGAHNIFFGLRLLFLTYYNTFFLKSNPSQGRELMAEFFQMMVLPVCKVLKTHFIKCYHVFPRFCIILFRIPVPE